MISVENHRYRVELECIGEGVSGDYDPLDPTDVPLLRYTLLTGDPLLAPHSERREDGWAPVENGSYCTLLPDEMTDQDKTVAAQIILDRVTDTGPRKRALEDLSWINPEWVARRKLA